MGPDPFQYTWLINPTSRHHRLKLGYLHTLFLTAERQLQDLRDLIESIVYNMQKNSKRKQKDRAQELGFAR